MRPLQNSGLLSHNSEAPALYKNTIQDIDGQLTVELTICPDSSIICLYSVILRQARGSFACPSEPVSFGSGTEDMYSYTHYSINVYLSETLTKSEGMNLWRPLPALTNPSQAKLITDSKISDNYAFYSRWHPAYRT